MKQNPITVQAPNPETARAEGVRLLGLSPDEINVTKAGPDRYTVAAKDSPGRFSIHLQADRNAAFLEIHSLPRGNGEPVSLDQVLNALGQQNIVFGIDKEQIRQSLTESENGILGKRVCIARGGDPEPGQNGRIVLKIGADAANTDAEAALMARHGQILAVRSPATTGAPGMNIFGEEIPARPATDPPLEAGANVRLSSDGLTYLAEIYGRVSIADGIISVANLVEIDEDRMAAWMDIYQVLADNSRLELPGVTATLTAAGIVHGILEEEIRAALAGDRPVLRMQVARGTPGGRGKDAEVLFGFRLNGADPAAVDGFRREGKLDPKRISKELVLAGKVLATKIPAEPAKDGSTVIGEALPGIQPRDFPLSSGENVLDDGKTFRVADSMVAGYADYSGGVLSVSDPLRVSEDSMQVLMEIHPPAGDNQGLTGELVIRMLKKHLITHGVSKKNLRRAVAYAAQKKMVLHDVIIARGMPPMPGRDACIEPYVVVEKIAGKVSEETGTIDFRERNALSTVKKGEVLARKIPPEPGVAGHDVHGRVLEAKPGADIQLIPQPNVTISEDGLTLTSDIDGVVSVLEKNKIAVFQVQEIKSDVDYAIGNLEMAGALHISGWIRTGFKVQASGEIQIGGGVEDAVVISGANVLINGGVICRGQGRIAAGGNVNVRFLERARVRAEGDVVARDQIMRSKLFTRGSLSVVAGRGQIRGGMAWARQGIVTNEIGSTAGVKTVVMAGTPPVLRRRLAIVNRKLTEHRQKRAKMDEVLSRFLAKGKEANLPKEITAKLTILARQRRELLQAEENLAKSREELTREIAAIDHKKIRITAKKAVYAGTVVVIGGMVHKVTEDILRPVSFILDEENRQIVSS